MSTDGAESTAPARGLHPDAAELVALIRVFGPWALPYWRPRGGFAHRDHVDLPTVLAALERLIS
ncbi:hypothetical protein [Streptomyces sp. NBC_01431]|uniref:hypothetical protein n=1 Tax=Streptomyces sp. NBC_01431 TaxID=2903863 RepID=UPI002E338915|nr:hypothetical protein [Streptomyces sp. NBC_01431]